MRCSRPHPPDGARFSTLASALRLRLARLSRVGSGIAWLRSLDRPTVLAFDLGARVYGWFTAQATWRASCATLAASLPVRPLGRPLRVLDLGCGPGVSTIEIARLRPEARLVGLDAAPRMLAEAQRRLETARRTGRLHASDARRIGWVLGDAAHLPVPDAALDAVTGHSVLYLLPDRQAALAEVRRCLRPGGAIVLMEPSARPARPQQVLGVSHDPRHVLAVSLWRPFSWLHGRFTPETLSQTLIRAGFAECRVEETLGGLGLLARAIRPP
ncbi:MAG: methyltransferase domain-containing protein [Chloroflexi bacterium]|nr:methyltransferase domain-containing protein [Chloroflexota bacterium]